MAVYVAYALDGVRERVSCHLDRRAPAAGRDCGDDFGVEAIALQGKTKRAQVNSVTARVVTVLDAQGAETVRMDGPAGATILANAACAEEFEARESEDISPGTVVIVDEDGWLRPCTAPYDRRVVGVVSGAGDLRPGILLGKRPTAGAGGPSWPGLLQGGHPIGPDSGRGSL